MANKPNPLDVDWTRPKYNGFKPLHKVEKVGLRVVLGDYLEKINLSQRSLAELCDLSQPAVNDLCGNKTQLLSMSTILRIISVLGCKMDDIVRVVPAKDSAYSAYDN